MEQLFFTISFQYDIIQGSLQVLLSAEIEMINGNTCIVRNIRRTDVDESPLLPELKLTNNYGKWVHSEGGTESNISKVVGEAIDLHRRNGQQDGSPKNDSR